MYLCDYHLHTQRSSDSAATLAGYVAQAQALGLSEICLTDHWNLMDQQANPLPLSHDWDGAEALIRQERDCCFGKLEIRLGVEVGNGISNPEAVAEVISDPRVDFVIGSVHNVGPDLGGIGIFTAAKACKSLEDCQVIMEDYMKNLLLTASSQGYDVIGHIVYPLRYFPEEFQVSLSPYTQELTQVLKAVVAQGKGIEVNTCKGSTLEEWRPILALYHQLGGEVLTLGSDAHGDGELGLGIKEASQMVADLGFRWLTTYRHRTAFFHKAAAL